MRIRSRATVVTTIILIFSMLTVPGLIGSQRGLGVAQGLPTEYPVIISLGDEERVFFANHASGLPNGNWIELSGGTTINLPSLKFVYDGPEVVSYTRGEVTVTIDSIPGQLTYPLKNHQVYNEGDSVSATFWGSTEFGGEEVVFMLLRVSSLAEIRDVLDEGFSGAIETLLDSLVWFPPYTINLNPTGDGTYNFNAPAAGDYILVVAKIDLNLLDPLNSKFYIYSATAIEIVDYTLDVSAASSVEKGDDLYVEATLIGAPADSYIYGFAMIRESSYRGRIELSTDGTVTSTQLYFNDIPMVEGDLFTEFFTGEKGQSDLNIDFIEELLNKAFAHNELSYAYSTAESTTLSTSSLATGKYVLLAGVWNDWDSRIVGLKQTTVRVTSPYEPAPTPKPNQKPIADAGPNQKALVGETIDFDGTGSYDKDGNIVSYIWDFGDKNTAEGPTPTHTYSELGQYTVTLTVWDNKNDKDTDKCTVKIWEPPVPILAKFGENLPGNLKGHTVNAMEEASTTVTLDTIDDVIITIYKYDGNPQPLDPIPATAIQIYVDVEVSNPEAVIWPIYVEMFYTDEDVEGIEESTLCIYYWKDGAWKRCSDTGVDTERNVVWAYMTAEEASGSPILMGGMPTMIIPVPPLPPILSDLTIVPSEIELGEEVNIDLDIENIDSQSFTYIVTMRIGELTLLVDVELEAYESKTVSRTITPDAVGDYDVTVDGLTGSFTVNPLPTPPRPAEFEFSNLAVSPDEVEEGEAVTVSVDVTNVGEETGSYTVELVLDGVVVESEEITPLEGGLTTTVIFEILGDVGTHQVEVEGMTVSFTVLPPPEEPPFWTQTGYIAGILTLIIAASAIIYAYRKGMLPLPSTRKD